MAMIRPEYTEILGDIESILTKRERLEPVKNLPLGKKQERFSVMFAGLMFKMFSDGYDVRIGDVLAHDGHIKNSCHYKKLAGDVNLFLNGKYLDSGAEHAPYGEWWKRFGGSWGGDFRDPNHYSIADGGSK